MKVIMTERQLNREADRRMNEMFRFREHEDMKWKLQRLNDDVRDLETKVKMILEATGLANPCTEPPKTVIDCRRELE